jgi:hypothetical protein
LGTPRYQFATVGEVDPLLFLGLTTVNLTGGCMAKKVANKAKKAAKKSSQKAVMAKANDTASRKQAKKKPEKAVGLVASMTDDGLTLA